VSRRSRRVKFVEVTEDDLPLFTAVGTKYVPTLREMHKIYGGCAACPVLEMCSTDVHERDGYAWCEELLDIDLLPQAVIELSQEA